MGLTCRMAQCACAVPCVVLTCRLPICKAVYWSENSLSVATWRPSLDVYTECAPFSRRRSSQVLNSSKYINCMQSLNYIPRGHSTHSRLSIRPSPHASHAPTHRIQLRIDPYICDDQPHACSYIFIDCVTFTIDYIWMRQRHWKTIVQADIVGFVTVHDLQLQQKIKSIFYSCLNSIGVAK